MNGVWVASWPDAPPGGSGFATAVVTVLLVGLLIGIGVTVWKVTTAQRLARQSGMDPSLASKMTLLSDDGLDATYLAASLRQAQQPPTRSTASRLEELAGLLDRGLVTQAEYDVRRKAIIDGL